MRRILLLSAPSLAPPYFSHYLINGAVFRRKLLNIKCVFRFSMQLLSKMFLIRRKIQWGIVINVKTYSCNPLFSLDFNETWISWTNCWKILKYQISWKYVQREPSCSMRTDGHDKASSRFQQLCQHQSVTRTLRVTKVSNTSTTNLALLPDVLNMPTVRPKQDGQ